MNQMIVNRPMGSLALEVGEDVGLVGLKVGEDVGALMGSARTP